MLPFRPHVVNGLIATKATKATITILQWHRHHQQQNTDFYQNVWRIEAILLAVLSVYFTYVHNLIISLFLPYLSTSVLYFRLLINSLFCSIYSCKSVTFLLFFDIIYLYFLWFLLSFDNGKMVKGKHGKVSPGCLSNHLSEPLFFPNNPHSVIISASQTNTSRLDVV